MVLKPWRKWMQRQHGLSNLSRNPRHIPLPLPLLLQVHRRHRRRLVPHQERPPLLPQDWVYHLHLLKDEEVALLHLHQVERPQQLSGLLPRSRQVRHLSLPGVQYHLHFTHLPLQHYLQKYHWTEMKDNQLHPAYLCGILIHHHRQNITTLSSMSLLHSMLRNCQSRHQMHRPLCQVETAGYRIHLPFQ